MYVISLFYQESGVKLKRTNISQSLPHIMAEQKRAYIWYEEIMSLSPHVFCFPAVILNTGMQRTNGERDGGSTDAVRRNLLQRTNTLVYANRTVGHSLSDGHNVVSSGHSELSSHLRVLGISQRTVEHHATGSSRRLHLLSKQRRMATPW